MLFLASLVNFNAQVYDVGSFAQMTGVSDNGVAVGNVYGVLQVIWTEADGGSAIGETSNDYIAGMTSISRDGNFVTGSMTNPATGKDEMARYNVASQQWTYLGGLGVSSGTDTSSAWGTSYDANTIVGLGWQTASRANAIKWTSTGGMLSLGSTVSGRSSRANSVSGDGKIVVGWQDNTTGSRQGVYWKDGVQNYIKTTNGENVGEAIAASADGDVIVGMALNGDAFRWSATEGYTAIAPPYPSYHGSATAVSSDGNTIVGYFTPDGGMALDGEGFIWTKTGGLKTFNDYVASLGYDTLDLNFVLPMAISPNGKYLAGIAINTEDARGFVIKLADETMATADSSKESKIGVYPNPAKDVLNIKNAGKLDTIEIFNMAGQKVSSNKNIENKQIDIQSLMKGSYLLKVNNDGKTESIKFIKE